MASKSLVTLCYEIFGITLGLLPLLPRLLPDLQHILDEPWQEYVTYLFFGLALVVVSDGSVGTLAVLAVAACTALYAGTQLRAASWLTRLAPAAALLLTCSWLWWRRAAGITLQLSFFEAATFVVISILALFALAHARGPQTSRPRVSLPFAVYGVIATWLCFGTFALEQPAGVDAAWHHWGAYIGPAELTLSGAHLFADFPAQYGFGPTVTLAATCGSDCWLAMYRLTGVFNLGSALLVGWMAVLLLGPTRTLVGECIALCLALVCTLLWTSLPSNLVSPLVFPSVNGMRFLPIEALLACCLLEERSAGRFSPWWGAGLWAFGVLWAPESAFYCTLLWWPFRLSRVLRERQENGLALVPTLVRSGLGLLAGLALVCGVFLLGYRLVYGELPTSVGLFVYIQNPPAPLPIEIHGAVLFALALLVLATGNLLAHAHDEARHGTWTPDSGIQFALLLASYGTWSYFLLGRSHDNNILNLSPMFLLLALSLSLRAVRAEWQTAARALCASYLGWTVVMGWSVWGAALDEGRMLRFDPAAAFSHFDYSDPLQGRILQRQWPRMLSSPADLARTLTVLRATHLGPADVINMPFDMPRTAPDQVWNAYHSPENYAGMPAPVRREFLRRTQQRLQRCGWMIVDGALGDGVGGMPSKVEWLTDFDPLYDMDQQVQVGGYHAFHLKPKGMEKCPAY
jgi:hypothetical protein